MRCTQIRPSSLQMPACWQPVVRSNEHLMRGPDLLALLALLPIANRQLRSKVQSSGGLCPIAKKKFPRWRSVEPPLRFAPMRIRDGQATNSLPLKQFVPCTFGAEEVACSDSKSATLRLPCTPHPQLSLVNHGALGQTGPPLGEKYYVEAIALSRLWEGHADSLLARGSWLGLAFVDSREMTR